jgi:hypothetical protein
MNDRAPTAEAAVRQYLLWITSPDSLRDEGRIAELQSTVDGTSDPIEKLKALSALEDARTIDGDRIRADFVAHARDYVAGEGIRVDAFRTMGVADDVLRDAGLLGGPPSRSSARVDSARRKPGGNRRMPRLNLSDVEASLPEGDFKLADFAAAIDREVATTRNYLIRLVGDGKVVEVGEDASGRGKPAKVYRRA